MLFSDKLQSNSSSPSTSPNEAYGDRTERSGCDVMRQLSSRSLFSKLKSIVSNLVLYHPLTGWNKKMHTYMGFN